VILVNIYWKENKNSIRQRRTELNPKLNLFNYLYRDEVKNEILLDNKELLELSTELLAYVEDEFLALLNRVSLENSDDNRVNQAIFILFAQAVKSVKSSLVLCMEGYLTNSVMCIRNCLEIIFNIKYIVGEKDKSLNRAEKYLTKPTYWTNDTVKERAYKELDRPLYEIYKIFSNYTHSNLMGAGQNILNDHSISTLPSTEKSSQLINVINSLFYSLIKYVSDYYNIENQKFNSIELSDDSTKMLQLFDVERNVVDFFMGLIKDMGIPEENIEGIIKEYKKHSLKPRRKKNKK
jgi:hypothetical protein